MISKYFQRLAVKQALLTLLVALSLSVALSMIGAVSYLGTSQEVVSSQIKLQTQAVHPAASEAVFRLDPELAADVVDGLLRFPLVASVSLYDENNSILASAKKERRETWYQGLAHWAYDAISEHELVLSHSKYAQELGRLHVQLDVNYVASLYIEQFLAILSAALVGSFLLAIVIAVIFYYTFTNPLLQVSNAVLTATPGSGNAFKETQEIARREDELGQLTASLTAQFQRYEDVLAERSELASQLHIRNASIAAMNNGLVISDATSPDLPIIDVNQGFESITGYAREEIIGKNWFFLLGKDSAAELVSKMHEALEQGASFSGMILCYRKNGSQFWNDLSLDPVKGDSGEIQYYVSHMEDVSDWREAEDLLRRRQKMDAIGNMTGGVAHDFNNILAIMLGHLELLRDDLADQPQLKEAVDLIFHAGQRAATLTARLLRFSKTESGNVIVTSVDKLINGMRDMLAGSFTPRISVEYDLDSNPHRVLVDPGDLEDAVLNLALNAQDAISGTGAVTISTRHRILQEGDPELGDRLDPGSYVQLSISDSGSGMAQETIERVFEPFFSTKKENGGTGLGLAQVYGFVMRSRGDIQIYSELEVGTSFLVYLPTTEQESKPQDVDLPTEALIGGDETILVVDDEAELVKLAQRSLSNLGYRVLIAQDVTAALEIFNDNMSSIDLLVSDIVMPKLNGYELAAKMISLKPQLRVLLASGFSTNINPVEGYEHLQQHQLSKPYTIAELCNAVRAALNAQA
ncbi:MAG: PAS domain-containing protein [Halieaceae bacterium]|nr:PAS domain-containing protein [Halieaceae bacterium]